MLLALKVAAFIGSIVALLRLFGFPGSQNIQAAIICGFFIATVAFWLFPTARLWERSGGRSNGGG